MVEVRASQVSADGFTRAMLAGIAGAICGASLLCFGVGAIVIWLVLVTIAPILIGRKARKHALLRALAFNVFATLTPFVYLLGRPSHVRWSEDTRQLMVTFAMAVVPAVFTSLLAIPAARARLAQPSEPK